MYKVVKTRLEKPTETFHLNRRELMDPRLIAGKPAYGRPRPLNVAVSEEAWTIYAGSGSESVFIASV